MATVTPKLLSMHCARHLRPQNSGLPLQGSIARPSIAAIKSFLFPASQTPSSQPSSKPFSTTTPLQRRDPAGHTRFGRRGRHQVRHPRYYRGPLHPHQPPKPSDPSSRLFIPGPFTSERLWDHFNDTISADFMTLAYEHIPPGTPPVVRKERLRTWEGDSPYFANRPRRGPRGRDFLKLLSKPITFRNIPRLEEIIFHCYSDASLRDPMAINVASAVAQAVTGVKAEIHLAKKSVAHWGLKKDMKISVVSRMSGPGMYKFLATCIEVVMPRIKEFKGVRGSTGDRSGNLTFGFDPEIVAQFPEVEANYDMYPAKMIPGCHITCKTTARNDRDARMLLASFGIPFYGKMEDW
ncbi:hypothetical protein TWF696_005914 [Orbilia brochopaga]|uniref:Ribosomal protein L5 n=1 Tax=Orbilia brochopaga TaxID=3140254 RepID=A0AAV9UXG0_9PEZI